MSVRATGKRPPFWLAPRSASNMGWTGSQRLSPFCASYLPWHLRQAFSPQLSRTVPRIERVADSDTVTLANSSRMRFVKIDEPEVQFGLVMTMALDRETL